MELMASRETCVQLPAHLPITMNQVHHTVIVNMRPYVPTRQVLLTLHSDARIWASISRDLAAIFIMPEVETVRGAQSKWSALFIWNRSRPGVSTAACQQLAGRNSHGGFLTVTPALIDLHSSMMQGLTTFIKLGRAYASISNTDSTHALRQKTRDGIKRKNDRQSREPLNSPRKTSKQLAPTGSPTFYSPDPQPLLSSQARHTSGHAAYPPSFMTPPPRTTEVYKLAYSSADSDGSHDSDSDYCPSDQDMATSDLSEHVQNAIHEATKSLQSQLQLQQQRNAELDAKLASLTDTIREDSRLNKLREDARSLAAQRSRKSEALVSANDALALLNAELDAGQLTGRALNSVDSIKHKQLTLQITKLDGQIARITNDLQLLCDQLEEPISTYVIDDDL